MHLPLATLLFCSLAVVQGSPVREKRQLGQGASSFKKRVTGIDPENLPDTMQRWSIAGTDLGIPYVLENGAIGFLLGDTFSTQRPEEVVDWRSPVLLRSAIQPGESGGIVFDSAAGVNGDGFADQVMHNGRNGADGMGATEASVIPNDAVGFEKTGDQVMSYMSISKWGVPWSTNYAGLAISHDGSTFERLDVKWENNGDNSDPFQMWTMQHDGDYVYVFSVRAGRQKSPMMLQRVPWDNMVDKTAYECWGSDGSTWDWGMPCTSIFPERTFGEPSVRKLSDGTWAMAYLDLTGVPEIVTRTANGPDQEWSDPKVQVTASQEQNLYGGFIHPWSTSEENDLYLMVSRWSKDAKEVTTHYHVSQYTGTL